MTYTPDETTSREQYLIDHLDETNHLNTTNTNLLAALVLCEATITELVRDHPEWVVACDKIALREARAAIYKARGQWEAYKEHLDD